MTSAADGNPGFELDMEVERFVKDVLINCDIMEDQLSQSMQMVSIQHENMAVVNHSQTSVSNAELTAPIDVMNRLTLPAMLHPPQKPQTTSKAAEVDPYDPNICFPTVTASVISAKRNKQSLPKRTRPTQCEELLTRVPNSDNLVSFSYRRRDSTERGITTKEVSIHFCDESIASRMDSTKKCKVRSNGIASKKKPTGGKKKAELKIDNHQTKRKRWSTKKSESNSSADEILPISKRMAAKYSLGCSKVVAKSTTVDASDLERGIYIM